MVVRLGAGGSDLVAGAVALALATGVVVAVDAAQVTADGQELGIVIPQPREHWIVEQLPVADQPAPLS